VEKALVSERVTGFLGLADFAYSSPLTVGRLKGLIRGSSDLSVTEVEGKIVIGWGFDPN
jgi:hypothetical protein